MNRKSVIKIQIWFNLRNQILLDVREDARHGESQKSLASSSYILFSQDIYYKGKYYRNYGIEITTENI